MSVSDDLSFACKKNISIKGEVDISETQLLAQIFDGVEVTHVNHSVKTGKESEVVNGLCHETEDNQTKLNDCEGIREQPYECNLRSDDSSSSARKDDIRPSLKNNHTCSICAKLFRTSSRLEGHMNFHTGNPPYASAICPRTIAIHEPRRNNHACSVCAKAYRYEAQLRVHMNVHTGNRPYICTICSKAFNWPSNLRRHMSTHLSAEVKNRIKFKCTLCEKLCSSRSQLNCHMNMHGGERPFKCETCPKTFTSPDALWSHKKLHADDGVSECTLCNQKFTGNSKRRRHEKTHTNSQLKYQCAKCKKYFRLEDQYRSHLEDNKCTGHALEKPFECSKCENESFISIELLNQHKAKFHPPPKNSHICLICTKTYKHKYLLNIHMNSHTGSRPYTCPICPKRFACPGNLRWHKLAHNLSAEGKIHGRFKCTLCEKSYRSKIGLNSHMYFHRGERPFKCEICPKSFTNPDSLRTHIKKHSDERKYECTLCNKKYTLNSDRRVHEKTHTNSRMNYQCEKCKMYFRLENQYDSHLKDNKCKGYALNKPFQCSKGDNESFAIIKNLIPHKGKDKCNRNCQESDHVRENKKCETLVQNEIKNIQNDEQSQENDAFEKKYKCDECKKEFICKRNLNFHLRSHLQIA